MLSLPVCCRREAFHKLEAQIPRLRSSECLLEATVAIGMHECPEASSEAVSDGIQEITDRVRKEVKGPQPQAKLAWLHEVMFEERKFAGNTLDYYNPHNSYLHSVLETKLGLPISLSLVYVLAAQRLGLQSWGVGLPGHFLAAVSLNDHPLFIDTFAGGRVMTPAEAHVRMQEIFGPDIKWSEDLLQPASHRHWLTRMTQNLINIFTSAGQYADVAAMLEMEMLLWPDTTKLQRNLGLVLARIGLSQPAADWLSFYIDSKPNDPDIENLKQIVGTLKS